MNKNVSILVILLSTFFLAAPISNPPQYIAPGKVAVFINDNDPVSIAVGAYYVAARNIPAGNVIHVNIPTAGVLEKATFNSALWPAITGLPSTINATVITWSRPYTVKDTTIGQADWERPQMSITSAFAFGTGAAYFKPRPGQLACVGVNYPSNPNAYPASPLYDAQKQNYFQNLGVRLSMMIAAKWYTPGNSLEEQAAIDAAKDLIDRGTQADQSHPLFKALLVRTSNDPRSLPRQADFEWVRDNYPPVNPDGYQKVNVEYWNNHNNQLGNNFPVNRTDLMAYETGHWCIPDVRDVATPPHGNSYLPGAFASHLTSLGGALSTTALCDVSGGSAQLPILKWIESGVTGTSGNVREPCAFAEKFHQVSILMAHYLAAETLIEAQWKSVKVPYELLFIGEPLANPYKRPLLHPSITP